MNIDPSVIMKCQLTVAIVVMAAGMITTITRRAAVWTSLGSALSVKGILLALGVVFASGVDARAPNLAKLVLVANLVLLLGVLGSAAVALAGKRSSGTLDLEQEKNLRN